MYSLSIKFSDRVLASVVYSLYVLPPNLIIFYESETDKKQERFNEFLLIFTEEYKYVSVNLTAHYIHQC